jgi:hypothetical protein
MRPTDSEQVVVDVIWTPICVTGSKIKAQVSKEWIGKGYGNHGTWDRRLTCILVMISDDVVDVLGAWPVCAVGPCSLWRPCSRTCMASVLVCLV